MAFRFKDKKDIKAFILYLFLQIERPVDMSTVNDIVMQDDFVNQFDLLDAFYELCSSGAIIKENVDGTDIFSISSKGRTAAEMLESNISVPIKERAALSAMRLISFERTGARSKSAVVEKDGKFSVELCVYDKGGERMTVSISVDSQRRANAMKRTFDEKPEFVYRALLGVLSGDINYLAQSWVGDEDVSDDT